MLCQELMPFMLRKSHLAMYVSCECGLTTRYYKSCQSTLAFICMQYLLLHLDAEKKETAFAIDDQSS